MPPDQSAVSFIHAWGERVVDLARAAHRRNAGLLFYFLAGRAQSVGCFGHEISATLSTRHAIERAIPVTRPDRNFSPVPRVGRYSRTHPQVRFTRVHLD